MEHGKDLSRFIDAHERCYQTALNEVRNGRKVSHWMWYIFPQIQGLGRSSTSQYYSIRDINEAKDFLHDTYLGGNLTEICLALLELNTDDPTSVFGKPDDIKLRSCMTLFAVISDDKSVFDRVLDKFFEGKKDKRTLKILGLNNSF